MEWDKRHKSQQPNIRKPGFVGGIWNTEPAGRLVANTAPSVRNIMMINMFRSWPSVTSKLVVSYKMQESNNYSWFGAERVIACMKRLDKQIKKTIPLTPSTQNSPASSTNACLERSISIRNKISLSLQISGKLALIVLAYSNALPPKSFTNYSIITW